MADYDSLVLSKDVFKIDEAGVGYPRMTHRSTQAHPPIHSTSIVPASMVAPSGSCFPEGSESVLLCGIRDSPGFREFHCRYSSQKSEGPPGPAGAPIPPLAPGRSTSRQTLVMLPKEGNR